MTIKHKSKTTIQVPIDRSNGLCKTPLTAYPRESPIHTQIEQINNTHQTSSLPDLIQYLHAAAFVSVTSICIEAIDNIFLQ